MTYQKTVDTYEHCRREAITKRFVITLDFILHNQLRGTTSDVQLAQSLQVVRQVVSNIRRGSQDATIEHIAILCDYYNVSAMYIMQGKGKIGEVWNEDRIAALERRMEALEILQ